MAASKRDLIQLLNHRLMIPVWKNRDLSVLDHICSPDIDVRTTFYTGRGLDAAKTSVQQLFDAFPQFDLQVEDIFQQDNRITYKWSAKALHQGTILNIPPTGKTLTFHGIAFLEMEGNMAVKYHSFSNMPQILYAASITALPTVASNPTELMNPQFPSYTLLLDHENYDKEISELLFLIAEKMNARLTRRELECLNFWVKGYSIKDTARQLGGLSVKTIQTFRDNIRKKCQVTSYRELLQKLKQTGLLTIFSMKN